MAGTRQRSPLAEGSCTGLLLASASGYASTCKELAEITDRPKYVHGHDPRRANCMAHRDYEPTAMLATIGSLKESLRALTGAQRGKIKEAEMACTCDSAVVSAELAPRVRA